MSRAFDLTDRVVRAAEIRARKITIKDSRVPGLEVRVQPNGSRSWTIRFVEDGRQRRLTLGRVEDVTVKAARARAVAETGRAVPQVRPKHAGPTFKALSDAFWTANKDHYAVSTREVQLSRIDRHLVPAFGETRVQAIRP